MARTLAAATIVALLVVALVAGCTSAIQGTAPAGSTAAGGVAPTATLTQPQQLVFGQALFNLGCVCHPTSQEGAPAVSQVSSLPASTIERIVRQGAGRMPMWNEQQLSADWLNLIVSYLQAIQKRTPIPTVSP